MSGGCIVLEEHVVPGYEPTAKEIEEYAEWLGMDPEGDKHLFWIAERGLKAPLPAPWKPCQSEDEEIFYFNFETGESAWDHPCDDLHRKLYQKHRRRDEGLATVFLRPHVDEKHDVERLTPQSPNNYQTTIGVVEREAKRANAVISNVLLLLGEDGHKLIGSRRPLVCSRRAKMDMRRKHEDRRDEAVACSRGLLALKTLTSHLDSPLARVGREALTNITQCLGPRDTPDPVSECEQNDDDDGRCNCLNLDLLLALYPLPDALLKGCDTLSESEGESEGEADCPRSCGTGNRLQCLCCRPSKDDSLGWRRDDTSSPPDSPRSSRAADADGPSYKEWHSPRYSWTADAEARWRMLQEQTVEDVMMR
jgi:hypothetical protein